MARYVVDSRALHFTIEVLKLPAKSYQDKEDKNADDKHLIKCQVYTHEISVFDTSQQFTNPR